MLERFAKAKKGEIEALRKLAASGSMPLPRPGVRPGFIASLKSSPGAAVIAEYKRASPSKGDINLAHAPEKVAAAYAKAGARAISVLTEETYFKGNIAYLEAMSAAGLPLLRKDFIIHPLQVDATAATAASAVLVIVRMVDAVLLGDLLCRCASHGLEAVVEVFDEFDLGRAKAAGASVIQVNNRDLKTLKVDLGVSERMAGFRSDGETWISASGVRTRDDMTRLLDQGFDAVLVGTSLMSGADPGAGLAGLLGEARE